jgi:hypothetical protein
VVNSPELADYYAIQTVPTLITFYNAEMCERLEDYADDAQIDELITALIDRAQYDS